MLPDLWIIQLKQNRKSLNATLFEKQMALLVTKMTVKGKSWVTHQFKQQIFNHHSGKQVHTVLDDT